MIGLVLKALILNEVRLRLRRLSTIVALLAVAAITWAMIDDPAGGTALLVVDNARVLYTSSALALGSASLASLLFGLGGFYLVRGRAAEDIRSGAGGVIGATPVGGALFLAGRWLGAVAYLGLLTLAFMGTILACHALRGDGPIQPLIYLASFGLMLVPCLFFAASCAVLFDSWAPLMGKRGDVLFFLVWVAQLSMVALVENKGAAALRWTLFDFTGTTASFLALANHVDTRHLSLGSGEFDAALAPIMLPDLMWSAKIAAIRCGTAVLAMLPLAPAAWLFHRYSPDKVKVGSSRPRRSPLAVLDGWLRPLSWLARPLFPLAARMPGWCGQAVADVALTLAASPSAIAALLAALAASVVVPAHALGAVLMASVAVWGILASEISTRDFQAGTEEMTGVVEGGSVRRYLRQYAAAAMLGLMFTGVAAARFSMHDPVRAGAVVTGVLALAALANLTGRSSRTPRLFMSLFLFGLYVAANAIKAPMIDAVGFNGAANAHSATTWLAIGCAALAAGLALNQRR